MDRLREAMATRRHTMVATMLDTKGPEVRTGKLESGGPVCYQKGTEVEITTDYEVRGHV
jgi:pyruvate kinase